jgi:DNA-binding LacI/PurR family transcriptional regulator/uncharacterized protein YeaC (DUF1315 family)
MYEVIYKDILNDIRKGKWPKGSRLPSEKELAQMYGVSRITSKRALEMLANEGRISRMPGRGSFVLEQKEEPEEETVQNREAGMLQPKPAGREKTIGVIFDSFDQDFGMSLLKSIEQECSRRNLCMLLKCTYGSIEAENQAIKNAVEVGVRGLILMSAQNETYNTEILKLALEKFPMVLVDRTMQGILIPCVKTDNYMAAKEMTRLLVERGHRNLCFVTHSSINTPTIRERYEGFADGILEYDGVSGKTMQISEYNPTPEEEKEDQVAFNHEEIRKLLRDHEECSAFLCIETKLCSILRVEMMEMGMEREIVSFDGTGSGGSENVIAYVKQDEREMGISAVDSLEQIMNGASVTGDICVPYQIRKCK